MKWITAKTALVSSAAMLLLACGGGDGGVASNGSGTSGTTASVMATAAATTTTTTGGYADVRSDGVTGAGSSPLTTVTVSTASAMQSAIDAYSGTGGLLINYAGTFDFSKITDPCTQWKLPAGDIVEIKNKSNITILGANGSGANFGLAIKSGSENIIVRNMTIGLLPGKIDALGIEGQAGKVPGYIWIDHNTLFSSMTECSGAGDLEFDGLIDSKKGAHHITYSYNYIHDHHKVGLMGYTESDITDRYVTFHHNYYKNVGSRIPLQRGGYTHMYNNLYSQLTVSGINVRQGGYALIESNYFENSYNPITSRDSTNQGYWELRNNNITNASQFSTYGITWDTCTGDCVKNASDWATTASFPKTIPYSYTPNTPACVKSGLPAVVGAGKNLATLSCS
ncbi:polysaccharide lyase family 1 protein [Curvibacter sp. CHRR-16]|uniref:pectate lyase family protein n=1 Tax=Curvibacter sp. CHRR-16 TaxID=2835872 RepID=UPI001BDAEC51|nr:polysaccharide lyase family 1 protein [Curvibacter sp. CHRR-16]MBT0570833.1 polysaccharide lyase family 1 protein [Curvibacter sp. CHRR-16]